jgi:hypothetical protein
MPEVALPLTSDAVTPVSEVRWFTASTMFGTRVPDVKSISSTPRLPPIWSVTRAGEVPAGAQRAHTRLHEQGTLLGGVQHVDLDLELRRPDERGARDLGLGDLRRVHAAGDVVQAAVQQVEPAERRRCC